MSRYLTRNQRLFDVGRWREGAKNGLCPSRVHLKEKGLGIGCQRLDLDRRDTITDHTHVRYTPFEFGICRKAGAELWIWPSSVHLEVGTRPGACVHLTAILSCEPCNPLQGDERMEFNGEH